MPKILGVDIKSNKLHYVIVEKNAAEQKVRWGKPIVLGDPIDPSSLAACQKGISTLMVGESPTHVAIAQKIKKGRMSAGEAGIKIEGFLLATVTACLKFHSNAAIKKCEEGHSGLPASLETAFRAAALTAAKL